ncbi:MAG: efflux RND transporter periplasmic adaptor subunit [Bacteroidetes bacterium]|nr:efflux RND transporter periplasmic adaptor subunit [Bacteroidota bacterium]
MNKSIVLNLFLVLLFVFGSSCSGGKKKKDGKDMASISFIEGYVVTPSVVDETIGISGTLKPFEETVLMPEMPGRVVMVNLPEGQLVKKGTMLIKIFDLDLQAQLKKAQTQYEIGKQILDRQAELLKVDGISQVEYDQQALLVTSVKNDIDLLKAQISKTEVLAPYDGVIGLRNISLGAQVTQSTPIATIRESDKLKLDFSVPGKYSSMIHRGTKVKFTVEGDEKKYDAEVMATEEGIDLNTRNLKARAIVESHAPALTPGAYASVELRLNENHNALMIPTQAIIMKERSKSVVVCKGGKAVFVPIQTGVRKAGSIEVIQGLAVGDTVVTTGVLFIKPDMELTFAKIK